MSSLPPKKGGMRRSKRPFVEATVFLVMEQDNQWTRTISFPVKHCCTPMPVNASPLPNGASWRYVCRCLCECSHGGAKEDKAGLGSQVGPGEPGQLEGLPSKGAVVNGSGLVCLGHELTLCWNSGSWGPTVDQGPEAEAHHMNIVNAGISRKTFM